MATEPKDAGAQAMAFKRWSKKGARERAAVTMKEAKPWLKRWQGHVKREPGK